MTLELGELLEIVGTPTRSSMAIILSAGHDEKRSDSHQETDPEVPLSEPVLEQQPQKQDRDETNQRDQPL